MNTIPKFYLRIENGQSMSFGISVYLDNDKEHIIFSQHTTSVYDHRKDLFSQFVQNENLGILEFEFDIYHCEKYINMNWGFYPPGMETSFKQNKGTADCRSWIWDLNSLRTRVLRKEPNTGGRVISRDF